MNKVTFICLLLLTTTLKANAQSYKITYGKLNTSTLEDLEQISNIGVKNNIISINNSFHLVEYELTISKEKARFSYLEKLNNPNLNKRAISAGGGSGIHYYDTKSNIKITQTPFSGKNYYVADSITKYNWKITTDTKKINDFLCYKAIATISYDDFRGKEVYNIEAWFCPEIPFPYGPDIYFGLPGLVFEAYKQNSKIKFYVKKIEKIEGEIKIDMPTEKTITEEEMTAIFNKAMEDLVNQN